MSTTFSGANKLCATCACWCGNRNIKCGWVEVDSAITKGKCGSPGSAYRNVDKAAITAGCNKWQKWPILK